MYTTSPIRAVAVDAPVAVVVRVTVALRGLLADSPARTAEIGALAHRVHHPDEVVGDQAEEIRRAAGAADVAVDDHVVLGCDGQLAAVRAP